MTGALARPAAPRVKVASLAESDHMLRSNPRLFGFGESGFNPLFDDQRSHQIPQKRPPVLCVSAKFSSVITMPHL